MGQARPEFCICEIGNMISWVIVNLSLKKFFNATLHVTQIHQRCRFSGNFLKSRHIQPVSRNLSALFVQQLGQILQIILKFRTYLMIQLASLIHPIHQIQKDIQSHRWSVYGEQPYISFRFQVYFVVSGKCEPFSAAILAIVQLASRLSVPLDWFCIHKGPNIA